MYISNKMESYSTSHVSYDHYYHSSSDQCPEGSLLDLTNATDDEVKFYFYPSITTVTLYIQCMIALVGFLCNLTFLLIVWKVPYMRNSMNFILLNLSVADAVFLMVGTGVKLVKRINSPMIEDCLYFGHIFECIIINSLLNTVSFSSLLLVSLISVERYIAVCRPHQYVKVTDRRRTLVYVGSVWIFSFLLAILLIPSRLDFYVTCIQWPDAPSYANFPAKVGFCEAKSDFWISLDECLQTFPFFIALTINLVCFAKIIAGLYSRMAPSSKLWQTQRHEQSGKARKPPTHIVTRMLLINGIAFFVLATPFHVTNAVQFIENIATEWWCDCLEFKEISVLFLYMNSAVNPLIYGITNPTYRRAYHSFFFERRCSSRRRHSTMSSSDNTTVKRTTSI